MSRQRYYPMTLAGYRQAFNDLVDMIPGARVTVFALPTFARVCREARQYVRDTAQPVE